jgi:hypothetical protein
MATQIVNLMQSVCHAVLDARNLQLVQQWGGGERWDGEALLRSTQLELQQLFNQTLGIKLYHRLADSRRRCQEVGWGGRGSSWPSAWLAGWRAAQGVCLPAL